MSDSFTTAATAEAQRAYQDTGMPRYDLAIHMAAWARDHLAAQEPTDAEVEAAKAVLDSFEYADEPQSIRDALSAARAVRAEAQSETRRQQTAYWQERADLFEAKMNELDRAYISEHGQRRRAEDEQDRLKNKLARRSETVSRLLEERNNAEARIEDVRGVCAGWEASDNWAALIAAGTIRRALDAP